MPPRHCGYSYFRCYISEISHLEKGLILRKNFDRHIDEAINIVQIWSIVFDITLPLNEIITYTSLLSIFTFLYINLKTKTYFTQQIWTNSYASHVIVMFKTKLFDCQVWSIMSSSICIVVLAKGNRYFDYRLPVLAYSLLVIYRNNLQFRKRTSKLHFPLNSCRNYTNKWKLIQQRESQ